MKKALYLSSNPSNSRVRYFSKNQPKLVIALILTAFMALSGISLLFSAHHKAEAVDWNQWIMCSVLPEPSSTLYQYSQTDDLPFMFRSKSLVGGSMGNVDSDLLNSIIEISGNSFKDVNEPIIGYSLDPNPDAEDTAQDNSNTEDGGNSNASETGAKKNYNGGDSVVSAYDRFGISGMNFTAYSGEWKYIVTDACDTTKGAKDPKANLYYEDRLEPRSTYQDAAGSSDARTIQFSKGIFAQYVNGLVDVIANAIFWLTKVIIVITIALIGFSFADVVQIMGLDQLIGGESGVFSAVFSGVFTPLVFLMFVITAIKLFYDAIVKKQYRSALTNVIRSIVLFILAIVIAANPTFWIALPNKIAVTAQAIVVTTLNSGIARDEGICATNVAAQTQEKTLVDKNTVFNFDKPQEVLDNASKNMQSSISCRFWEIFLLKPWSQGQFGQDYHKLWAKGKIPEWENKDIAADVDNVNEEMVGDAGVPIGDGQFVNNWAIYQLSTQTNAHVALGNEGSPAKYTNGVANDWWRIVDSLSNYSEVKKKITVNGSSAPITGQDSGSSTVSGSYTFPINPVRKTSDYGYRIHPVTGKKKLHAGIDYAGKNGQPQYAIADGTVTFKTSPTAGNILELKAVDGWTYRYLHLSGYSVAEGATVKSGDAIALTGSTGRVTGPHMHFETIDPSGTTINPNDRLKQLGFNPDDGSGTGATQEPGENITPTENSGTTSQVVEYSVPADNAVTPFWNDWVGNNGLNRLWSATSSVIIALIGVLAPLVFAALCTIYAFGIALMMSFAPLMLLLGCWAGKGWEIFKGWGQLVINTTIKRIITGLMLGLSLILTGVALKIMDDIGWATGMLIFILLTILLIRSRHKIVDMFASVNLSSVDLSSTAGRISNKISNTAKTATVKPLKRSGSAAGSVIAGGVGARAAGGSFRQGMKSGVQSELKNITMGSRTLRDVRATKDSFMYAKQRNNDGDESGLTFEDKKLLNSRKFCESCGRNLDQDFKNVMDYGSVFVGGRTPNGGLLCEDCYRDGRVKDSDQFIFEKPVEKVKKPETENAKKAAKEYANIQQGLSIYGADFMKHKIERFDAAMSDDSVTVKEYEDSLVSISKFTIRDIDDHRKAYDVKAANNDSKNEVIIETPKIPDHLKPYLDGSADILYTAWRDQNYGVIKKMYTAANFAWAADLLIENNKKITIDYTDLMNIINDPSVEESVRSHVEDEKDRTE